MTPALAVALLALLVALFTLVALVAVYARLRALEAGAGVGLGGYPTLVGRAAPASVRPGPGDRYALVAIVDGNCSLCRTLLAELAAIPPGSGVRVVALTDRAHDHPLPAGSVLVDVAARRFVYADTDVPALLRELVGQEVSPG